MDLAWSSAACARCSNSVPEVPCRGNNAAPRTRRQKDLLEPCLQRLGERAERTLRPNGRGIAIGDIAQQEDEFISTGAGRNVPFPGERPQAFRHIRQHGVPGFMAEARVHHAEAVEIEQQHSEPSILLARLADHRGQRFIEEHPIAESGERVVPRQIADALLVLSTLGDITIGAHGAAVRELLRPHLQDPPVGAPILVLATHERDGKSCRNAAEHVGGATIGHQDAALIGHHHQSLADVLDGRRQGAARAQQPQTAPQQQRPDRQRERAQHGAAENVLPPVVAPGSEHLARVEAHRGEKRISRDAMKAADALRPVVRVRPDDRAAPSPERLAEERRPRYIAADRRLTVRRVRPHDTVQADKIEGAVPKPELVIKSCQPAQDPPQGQGRRGIHHRR